MNASEIVQLLAVRHSKDVFVPECKNGPTHTANHLRLDAWAMARSWVNPCFDGYEIKVSRGDFMADQKMRAYLPLCNRLWVVCPRGLIQPEEIDSSMGLLWVASTGGRLMTKRRAPHRDIEAPVDLLLYVLMCRTRVQRESQGEPTREERAEEWRRYVDGQRTLRGIGYHVGKKLQADIEANLKLVEEANRAKDRAETRAERLDNVRALLDHLGIDPGSFMARDRLQDALSGKKLADAITRAHKAIQEVREIAMPKDTAARRAG